MPNERCDAWLRLIAPYDWIKAVPTATSASPSQHPTVSISFCFSWLL